MEEPEENLRAHTVGYEDGFLAGGLAGNLNMHFQAREVAVTDFEV